MTGKARLFSFTLAVFICAVLSCTVDAQQPRKPSPTRGDKKKADSKRVWPVSVRS